MPEVVLRLVTVYSGVPAADSYLPLMTLNMSCDEKRPNQALERTADRCEDLLSMISELKPEARLAFVSDRSSFSR
jgi:hypothetical protein